jgi:phosphatidylglycerophosphatase A
MSLESSDNIVEEDEEYVGINEFIGLQNSKPCNDSSLIYIVIGTLLIVTLIYIAMSSCNTSKMEKVNTDIEYRKDNVKSSVIATK